MTIPSTASAAYLAAYDGLALRDEPATGRILMQGRDAAALLHRLSTNDINRLAPGAGLRTALTTPIGRMRDLLGVHRLPTGLLLLTSEGQGGPVFSHLRQNIFFNDQVTLQPLGRSHIQIGLFGPQATPVLAELLGGPVDDMPLHGIRPVAWNDAEVLVIRRLPLGSGAAFTLLVPAEQATLVQQIRERAALLDDSSYDTLRVEAGHSAFGREISEEYIPLETGLDDAVSFSKGCYVGQEIIARMESRGRIAKLLRGLQLATLPESLPAPLLAEGKDAGIITSAVHSPQAGLIGLGYVRAAHASSGTILATADGQPVTVSELPFAK